MKILSCAFNMDTVCVELKIADGTMIAVDCSAVEATLDANTIQRGELDWLIYNKPLGLHKSAVPAVLFGST